MIDKIKTPNLNVLKIAVDTACLEFEAKIALTGKTKGDWFKTEARYKNGEALSSEELAFATDSEITKASDAKIKAVHEYYRARDGERGFLGKKGI